jgi:hypothetical protein
MVEMVGGISAFSAANPTSTVVRNSLDKVLDGTIKLLPMNTAPITTASDTFYTWGQADENAIYLNVDAATRTAAGNGSKFVDTLAHEVNHFLNGHTEAGTADRFLDEYRASLVGREAALGRPLTAAEQRASLMNLVDGTNPVYSHLASLLATDPKFAAGVKAITDKLNGSPPTTVSPEEARALLLGAGNNSDYLNKAGNLDNH